MPSRRDASLLIHVHVPLAEGDLFKDYLQRQFGPSLWIDRADERQAIAERIAAGEIRCIHGTFAPQTYDFVAHARYAAWIRDPIDRIGAAYSQWRMHTFPQDPLWQQFHREDWDFMRFATEPALRNVQSILLGGVMRRLPVLGIAEFPHESMMLFHNEFGFPDYDENEDLNEKLLPGGFDRFALSSRERAVLMNFHQDDYRLYLRGLSQFRAMIGEGVAIGWGPTAVGPLDWRGRMTTRCWMLAFAIRKKIRSIWNFAYERKPWAGRRKGSTHVDFTS